MWKGWTTQHLVLLASITVVVADAQRGGNDNLNYMLGQFSGGGGDVQSLSYCRISTRDLINTAQSTVNRVLHGVCNPRDLEERFKSLETKVVDQFNVLKVMVLNIEDKLRDQDEQVMKQHKKIHSVIVGNKSKKSQAKPSDVVGASNKLRSQHNHTTQTAVAVGVDPSDYYYTDYEEEFDVPEDVPHVSIRQEEMSKFNSTIHTQEDGIRVFTYYWQVHDIRYRMKNWGWRRSLRSQSFYVYQFGYKMYLRIYPNREGKNVYVHVGLTKGDFDDRLEWPFKLKHKINIVDHRSSPQDLSSRIWDPTQLCSGWNWRKPDFGDNFECVGLGFPQTVLETKGYIHDDSITIKLTVFIN